MQVEEQPLIAAVKGLTRRVNIKQEHLQIIDQALEYNNFNGEKWDDILNRNNINFALKDKIYTMEMVRLLTLRAIVNPDTMIEYLLWLNEGKKSKNDSLRYSLEFEKQIYNFLKEDKSLGFIKTNLIKISEQNKLLALSTKNELLNLKENLTKNVINYLKELLLKLNKTQRITIFTSTLFLFSAVFLIIYNTQPQQNISNQINIETQNNLQENKEKIYYDYLNQGLFYLQYVIDDFNNINENLDQTTGKSILEKVNINITNSQKFFKEIPPESKYYTYGQEYQKYNTKYQDAAEKWQQYFDNKNRSINQQISLPNFYF